MGILDDLKSQSEVKKADENKEVRSQEDLEKHYQANIHPKMLQMYTFFKELAEHLNYIKIETKATYPVTPGGIMQDFLQGDYKVTIDSINEVKNLKMSFSCSLEEPLIFELENVERIERYTDVLQNYHVEHERSDTKGPNYELISAKFKVTGPIPVNIALQGDVGTSSIHLVLNNFELPGISKRTFKEQDITEEFIDDFGKFILRQNPEFLKLDITDEDKEKIRESVQANIRQRQEELEEAERLIQLEEEKAAEAEKKKSWKSIFKK